MTWGLMCHENPSTSSCPVLKFESWKILRGEITSRRFSTCMWVCLQVYPMLPLRIYGTASRQAFSRQLRRCVAQLGPTVGIVKPGVERSLQPSGKLSRHGRLVKALEHHIPCSQMHCQVCSASHWPRRWQGGLQEYCPHDFRCIPSCKPV